MKAPILYPLLVGVPLLGLLGILRLGNDLVAPRSIGGEWDLSFVAPPAAAATGGCVWSAFGNQPPSFLISQSGTKAVVSFRDRSGTEMSITIDGDVITGSSADGRGEPCRTGPLSLEARLTEGPGAERMEGSFALAGCADCPPERFVAERRRAGRAEP